MLYFYVKLKKYNICINADVLSKCPKIGITVGSFLKQVYEFNLMYADIKTQLNVTKVQFHKCHARLIYVESQ